MDWTEVLEAVRGFEVAPEVAVLGLFLAGSLLVILGFRWQMRRLRVLLEEAREFVDKAKAAERRMR